MAKRARLEGLRLAAAFLGAGGPLVPARAPGTQMGVVPAASLTNTTSVLVRLIPAENVRAALIAPSHRQAPEPIVEQRDAAADPSVAAIGSFPNDTHPPIRSLAALTGISHKDAAACPGLVRSDKAKTALQALSRMVLSQGRS